MANQVKAETVAATAVSVAAADLGRIMGKKKATDPGHSHSLRLEDHDPSRPEQPAAAVQAFDLGPSSAKGVVETAWTWSWKIMMMTMMILVTRVRV